MNTEAQSTRDVSLDELQELIRQMYYAKDVARGLPATFMWFMEEVGELSTVLRDGDHQQRTEEFADVLAWLATMANVAGVSLSEAIAQKYGGGCPGCGRLVCVCPDHEKP